MAACSHGGIPFVVIDGLHVHVGTLVNPADLSAWNRTNDPSGAASVAGSVLTENGTPWQAVQVQAWWTTALLAPSTGPPVPVLATRHRWSVATTAAVEEDMNALA